MYRWKILGEEELTGFAQQSDQNGGQNGIYNVENNGSMQVSKKDGAVEDTISEELQELQGENNRSSWLNIVKNTKIDPVVQMGEHAAQVLTETTLNPSNGPSPTLKDWVSPDGHCRQPSISWAGSIDIANNELIHANRGETNGSISFVLGLIAESLEE
ncbi:hypothetical protein V6N12_024276 [Hibiscus sabdariffa]|uniref:Uncharacterized protein n=1 Tax=Hibiscus sabdariffa TaxID=183260 RepID=A0ABR2G034_9ROSI